MARRGSIVTFCLLLLASPWARAQNGVQAQVEEKVIRILRTSNKAQTNHYVAKAYVFDQNNPFAVRRFLQRPLAVEEGGIFTYGEYDDDGLCDHGIVVMICPAHQITYYDDLMQVLNRPGVGTADGSIRTYTKVKHRDVNDPSFFTTLSSFLTLDSFLLTDTETNAVYISDAPSGSNVAHAMLEGELDAPLPQAEMEITIYETEVSNDGTLGLDFMAWKNGPGRGLFALGAGYTYASKPRTNGGATLISGLPGSRFSSSSYSASYFFDVPSEFFDYLAVQGKSRVSARTRLTVLTTHTGTISTGEQILYYKAEAAVPDSDGTERTLVGALIGRATQEPTPLSELSAVETGVSLRITPVIGSSAPSPSNLSNDFVSNMEVEYSVVTLTGFDGAGVPQLASTTTGGKFRAKEGEEIVIGSLARTADIEDTQKVPFLGSLPIIGYLFGGETNAKKETLVTIVFKIRSLTAGETNLAPADEELIAQTRGDASTELPADEFAWNQFVLGEE